MVNPELRLVSLLPSGTEIIHALGLGPFQVGRSHECDYPLQVKQLPVCSGVNIDVTGSSASIDRLVKERATAALSIYDIDAALLRRLRPTHILTQTQCKVCAVHLADVQRAVCDLSGSGTTLLSFEPYCLQDVWDGILAVGQACDVVERAVKLLCELKDGMGAISERAAQAGISPGVVVLEWLQPLMAAGNWIPELVEMAHGRNLLGEAGKHSPFLEEDAVLRSDPTVLVIAACGFDLERSIRETKTLLQSPQWQALRAVQTNEVYVCDGNQYMSRPGPRLLQSLRIFAEILHPGLFEPTLEGIGWMRLKSSAAT